MKILVDKEKLEIVQAFLRQGRNEDASDIIIGILEPKNLLIKEDDKDQLEEWVVIEPRPVVTVDRTKTGFDKYSVEGTFNIINYFAQKEDALKAVEARKSYADLVIVRAMDVNKLVSRKKIIELREIIYKLELLKYDNCEVVNKLREAHQIIYEMQNPREERLKKY